MAGSVWREEIAQALNSCHLALLLISEHFLDSEYIQSVELPFLLRRSAQGLVRLIPVILRPCPWELTLGHLSALPPSKIPIVTFSQENGHRAQALKDIVLAVAKVLPECSVQANGPAPTELGRLRMPLQAAQLLLGLPSAEAVLQLGRLLDSGGGSADRLRILGDLARRALRADDYISTLLQRCFSSLPPASADALVMNLLRSLRDGRSQVLKPSNRPGQLMKEVDRFLERALIECARAKVSCYIVSCIGMSDNLNLETHIQTLAVSSLEVYINSPDLLLKIATSDQPFNLPEAVRDDYMLPPRGDGDTKVDVLRKLTRLFSSLYRLSAFRQSLLASAKGEGDVRVHFLNERRPPFTCRVLKGAGHFVLFPDSIALPRPLVRFAIVGKDIGLAESLIFASHSLLPRDHEPWVPTRRNCDALLAVAIENAAAALRQWEYGRSDLDVLAPVLGVRARGEGWIANRMLEGVAARL